MVTTVEQWRARNTPQEVELPSGAVALLRKVDILDLCFSGQIPTALVVEARQFADRGGVDVEALQNDPEALARWMRVIEPVVIAAFVEPKVGKEPGPEQLGIGEISAQDKLAIFQWCNEAAERLRPFRPGSDASMEPVSPGPGVQPEA